MAELRIVNVPRRLINQLDEYLSESPKYPDRSSLVVAMLRQNLLYKNRAFIEMLPDTTRILSEDATHKEAKKRGDLLEITLAAIHKNTELLEAIWNVLNNAGDLEDDENDDF
ncbi:MAG: hypothetical protein ABF904_14955 [Ethanoligenens sp.]